MHSLDSFYPMGIRTSSGHLFRSNSLVMMTLMILFLEKVRKSLFPIVDKNLLANSENTGLGFIMLLSGDPGVGKTLTAESGQSTILHNCHVMPR